MFIELDCEVLVSFEEDAGLERRGTSMADRLLDDRATSGMMTLEDKMKTCGRVCSESRKIDGEQVLWFGEMTNQGIRWVEE